MQPMNLPNFFNRLAGTLASFSVRTRIIVLALIPVAGFLFNGLTFMSGERDVGDAFETASKARALADASREFKIAIAAMRIAVKDFTAAPHGTLVDAFQQSQSDALRSLDTIENAGSGTRADDIKALRGELDGLKKNFDKLVAEQRTLGFNDNEGLRGELQSTGLNIERAINDNMTWLADTDAKELMMTLLVMRHYEAEYRLNSAELTRQEFQRAYRKFTQKF